MKLKIPSKEAIKILEKRKKEIHTDDFDHKVWKGKTENDLREIFDGSDFKWLQINHLDFEAPFTSPQNKYEVFQKAKKQAEQYIDSYIEQIVDYSRINSEKATEVEKTFELKYYKLQSEMNELIGETNSFLKDHQNLQNTVEKQDQEIDNLKKNTVQLSDISIKKLFHLLGNLPVGQLIAVITIFLAIISASFFVGKEIQVTKSNNDQYELRKQNKALEERNQSLQNEINSINKTELP